MKILLSLLALPFLYGASFFIGEPATPDARYEGIYIWAGENDISERLIIVTGANSGPLIVHDRRYGECSYSRLLDNVRFGKDKFSVDGELTGGTFMKSEEGNGILTSDDRFWIKRSARGTDIKALVEKFVAGRDAAEKFYDGFRAAVKSADTTALLAMCRFPIEYSTGIINIRGDDGEFEDIGTGGVNRKTFLQYYDQIFSPENRKFLLEATVERQLGTTNFFVRLSNDYALLWFRKVKGKYKLVRMGECPG